MMNEQQKSILNQAIENLQNVLNTLTLTGKKTWIK